MPSPTKDGTSFWEDLYKTVSEEYTDMSKWLLQTESPRPFGSEKVPEEEQVATYLAMRDDPDVLFEFFKEQGASLEGAVNYLKRMRKRAP